MTGINGGTAIVSTVYIYNKEIAFSKVLCSSNYSGQYGRGKQSEIMMGINEGTAIVSTFYIYNKEIAFRKSICTVLTIEGSTEEVNNVIL